MGENEDGIEPSTEDPSTPIEGGTKTMFSMLRNRLGVPGIISVIALVFAMMGGAYAASDNGGGNATASAKKKAAPQRGPRGPKGAKGDPGPAGPQGLPGANGAAGAKGDAGANGATGAKGDPGAKGADGADGDSVVLVNESPTSCADGGFTYEVEGSGEENEVCNGEAGETGFTATLPPGKTETGSFGALVEAIAPPDPSNALGAISFAIPLAQPIGETHVHMINPGDTVPSECNSGTPAAPKAAPGALCIYNSPASGVPASGVYKSSGFFEPGASVAGAVVVGSGELAGPPFFMGTYAVTGCGGATFPCPS